MKNSNILHFFYKIVIMKLLMVCLGNICRSPLAEGILKSKLDDNFIIDSAGTINYHQGKGPDERSVLVAKQNGIDISKQKSRPIIASDLDTFDYIFCMDESNLEDVLALAKSEEQKRKIHLYLKFGGLEQKNVPDPYYGGQKGFEDVFNLLEEASENVAKKLMNP